MFVHIWKMRARKKKVADYEKFGRQVTLPTLNKIDGCLDAHFVKVFESRKPEYFWLVLWRDHEALEAARTNPAWRDQIKKFEAGKFYKGIPIEYLCESVSSPAGAEKPKKEEKAEKVESPSKGFAATTPEGE